MVLRRGSGSQGGGAAAATDLGYLKQFRDHYELGRKLGKGGSGTVFLGKHKQTGAEFAVKVIPKVLTDAGASDRRRAAQLPSIRREVEVLLALRGSLNVAALEAAYEDDDSVYLVLELCRGGEVLGVAGQGRRVHHSERSVASLMRAVLQTVAQCHSRGVLHRDIKPENFLLLTSDEGAPLKAIDFGLAVFFGCDTLPMTAPNVEGTPWYLAPEACRGKWWPSTDVWACGVMAAYMLTGHYPFIDRLSPAMPDLARTLRCICRDELDLSGPHWEGLSPHAVDFVRALLVKDALKRPSATEALALPFLRHSNNQVDRPLHLSVVQRIQRFGQGSLFKRTVLEHVARDLVAMHFSADRSAHGGAVFQERSVRAGRAFFEGSQRAGGGRAGAPRAGEGSQRGGDGSVGAAMQRAFSASLHGGTAGLRGGSMRGERSVHGGAAVPAGMYLPVATPYSRRLAVVLDSIATDPAGKVDRAALRSSLQRLGYRVDDAEADELFDVVDVERRGALSRAELSASLLDWKWVRDTYKDRWVESVARVFRQLDGDGDGALAPADIAAAFAGHLDEYEVDAAVHEALLEAMGAEDGGEDCGLGPGTPEEGRQRIDFQHFLDLLQARGPLDDLELYDSRLSTHSSRHESIDLDQALAAQRGPLRRLLCCLG